MGYQGIQEHGMKLDFSVDKKSYNQATAALGQVNTLLNTLAQNAVKQFGEAALAVVGFDDILAKVGKAVKGAIQSGGQGTGGTGGGIQSTEAGVQSFAQSAVTSLGEVGMAFTTLATTAAGGMAAMLSNLGSTQIQMQILSRTLWTSQKQALAFSSSLSVLGASLQDLYLSPTLMQQYTALHKMAMQMSLPAGSAHAMNTIQNASLQLHKFQLAARYALIDVSVYFAEYMAGPLKTITRAMSGANGSVAKSLKSWASRVAAFMASVARSAARIWTALSSVYAFLQRLAAFVPGWAKVIVAALALVAISNPFALWSAAIAALLLLLNDFEKYLKTGKSSLAGFWAVLVYLAGGVKNLTRDVKMFVAALVAMKVVSVAVRGVNRLVVGVRAAVFATRAFIARAESLAIGVRSVASAVWGFTSSLAKNAWQMAVTAARWVASAAAMVAQKVAMIATTVATEAATVATAAFNAVMDANPIALIVIGVAALIAGLVLLVTHWKAVTTWVGHALNALGRFLGIPTLIKNVWDPLTRWFGGLWGGIMSGFDAVVNTIIRGLNDVINAANLIPGIHIPDIHTIGGAAAHAAASGHSPTRAVTPPSAYVPASSRFATHVAALAGHGGATKHVTINAPQNNNISGTSPEATAASIRRGYNRHLHDLRGAIG